MCNKWSNINIRKILKDDAPLCPDRIGISSNIFMRGEYGLWNDGIYVSLCDNNSYTPEEAYDKWMFIIEIY